VSVELKGMEGLERASRTVRGSAVFHLNSAAASCETIARALAPVLTGFHRDHIVQTEFATEGNLRSATEAQADYAEPLEYGTVNMDAQPSMTPAYESAKKQLLSIGRIF